MDIDGIETFLAIAEFGSSRQLARAGLDDAEVTLIDSLTAQKHLAQAGVGLALVPESSVCDEVRQVVLVALDIPSM
jgi:DNA-binding transcriptional LysR family regulator